MARTYNGVPFRQIWLPQSKYNLKAPYAMAPKKLTLHETDNQMPAINEANYHNSNNNQTSFHGVVDDVEYIQLIPYNRNAWHSGDGANGYGNRNTVALEIAQNFDRRRQTTALLEPLSSKYQQGVANAIKVGAQILIDIGRVANNDNIKTHNDWNGKHCPRKMRNDGKVMVVKAGIIAEYNRLKNPIKSGWVENKTGWWYQNADGSYPHDQWQKINGKWYLFDKRGYMLTGWQKVKDTWYYMSSSGAMQTGWVKLKDVWYYLNSNGSMTTGWQKVNNRWYYMNNNGAMQTGLITIGGKHYYLERSGALITDEVIKLEANKHGHLK